jgi:SAM-dependent methyltransferase
MENTNGRDAAQTMMGMITAYWTSQIVAAAARYSLPEHLAAGPVRADEIARREKLDPQATFRLLRGCATLGLVSYDADSGFAATPLLGMLAKDNPANMRGLALALTAPGHWDSWGRFAEAVATGTRQTLMALGDEIWDYYAKVRDEAAWFSEGMTGMTAAVAQATARVIDTHGVRTVADIGGANGAMLHALLIKDPALQGIVLDLPHVAEMAVDHARKLGLLDRVGVIGGDFFERVPPADLYLLKHIMHDWSDAECVCILENCRRAMRPGGRVAVIELSLGEIGEPGIAPLMDLNMLVMITGRERTLKEYEALFDAAGLRLSTVTRTGTPMVLMEAVSR